MNYSRSLINCIRTGEGYTGLPRLEIMPYHQDTLSRWYDEGLPESVKTLPELHDYFGLTDLCFQFFTTEIEQVTEQGPLGTSEAYRQAIATIYDTEAIERRLHEYERALQSTISANGILWVVLQGFFWHPRQIIGITEHLMMFYDDPDFLDEINKHLLEYNLLVIERIRRIGSPTIICVSEDMAYKQGSMISKSHFDTYLSPYHQEFVKAASDLDTILAVDSDGDITEVSGWFNSVGYHCVSPFERQCGQDFFTVREQNPDLGILGGFDKRAISLGPDAIDIEFEYVEKCLHTGRFLPAVDHQTSPEASLENYRYYLKAQEQWYARMGIL